LLSPYLFFVYRLYEKFAHFVSSIFFASSAVQNALVRLRYFVLIRGFVLNKTAAVQDIFFVHGCCCLFLGQSITSFPSMNGNRESQIPICDADSTPVDNSCNDLDTATCDFFRTHNLILVVESHAFAMGNTRKGNTRIGCKTRIGMTTNWNLDNTCCR
jgi:hypothetical protein